METQQPVSRMVESIQSFECIKATDGITNELVTQGGENNQDAIVDEVLDCDCGVMVITWPLKHFWYFCLSFVDRG